MCNGDAVRMDGVGRGGAVGARWMLRRDPTGGCLPREAPICQEIQAPNQKVMVAASQGRRRVASEPAKNLSWGC